MIEHARAAFALAKTDKDGVSMLEHLRQIEKSTGHRPSELDTPPVPDDLEHFWHSFLRIHRTRTKHEPIPFSEILAYCQLTGETFTPDEIDLISTLDMVWAEEQRN